MKNNVSHGTFSLSSQFSSACWTAVSYLITPFFAFNAAVSDSFAGNSLDKKISKARLTLAFGKNKQNKIKKGYGVRGLQRRLAQYSADERDIVRLAQQKISEATSEEEKKKVIQKYGKLCANNWLKSLNIMALEASKTDVHTSYISQRETWFKANREAFIPDHYLSGKVFKNSIV